MLNSLKNFVKSNIQKIRSIWFVITGQLWFTPLLICFITLAVLFSLTYLEYSHSFIDNIKEKVLETRLNNSKDIAVALMSSMLTVATLVVSITIVALSLASSQMGPRLIKAFIANEKTQIYFGLFFSASASAFYLVFLTHWEGFAREHFPLLTILFAMTYCFSMLFVLMFFVNHVARSCMTDTMIENVSQRLISDIKRLVTNQGYLTGLEGERVKEANDRPKRFKYDAGDIKARKTGYIQFIDFNPMLKTLRNYDAFLEFRYPIGEHVLQDQVLADIYVEKKKLTETEEFKDEIDALKKKIDIGDAPMRTQDLGYSIRHLSEIAMRALSPGINDPITATKVVNELIDALSLLFKKDYRLDFIIDEDNVPRIGGNARSLRDLVGMSLNQIREASYTRNDLNLYILKKLRQLSELTINDTQRDMVEEQIGYVEETIALQQTDSASKILKEEVKKARQFAKTFRQ